MVSIATLVEAEVVSMPDGSFVAHGLAHVCRRLLCTLYSRSLSKLSLNVTNDSALDDQKKISISQMNNDDDDDLSTQCFNGEGGPTPGAASGRIEGLVTEN